MSSKKKRPNQTEAGETASGVPFRPTSLSADHAPEAPHAATRAAPAPHSPLSDETMERLKQAAKESRERAPVVGQSDAAMRKKRH